MRKKLAPPAFQPAFTLYQAILTQIRTLPWIIVFALSVSILLADIIMPSSILWFFHIAQYHFQFWSTSSPPQIDGAILFNTILSTKDELIFSGSFIVLFVLYFCALAYLPQHITFSYILISTLFLGSLLIFMPIVTSQDIFSYIIYARMALFYHLNPLITSPIAIPDDTVYPFVYWIHQPSVYGPTWIIIVVVLQTIAALLGFKHILSIELLLRCWGLMAHLGSIYLIWQISHNLQHIQPHTEAAKMKRDKQCMVATLAFAWNPFLLLEACINAHNDTTILFFILLAVWIIYQYDQKQYGSTYLLAAACLAIVACLKISFIILLPGFLFYLWACHLPTNEKKNWRQRILPILAACGVYTTITVLLYAPFWGNGALLHVFTITPGTSRDINSLYEVLTRMYGYLIHAPIATPDQNQGMWPERISHQMSVAIFIIAYGILCLRALLKPSTITSVIDLVRWMASVWFLYCLLGSPWFWPWYMITFFGLAAILEANWQPHQKFNLPAFLRVLSISMPSIYCFVTFAPTTLIIPFWPYLSWMYLRGLLIWLPPLLLCTYYFIPSYTKSWKHL